MRMTILTLAVQSLFLLFVPSVFAHCEIPCGIYDDEMRIQLIEEHVSTLEKSVKTILALSKKKERNDNQIVRWVMNKEKHAGEIQTIVTQYFMTQRIKPVETVGTEVIKQYQTRLSLLHQILVQAMKVKQTTDLSHIEKLKDLTSQFREAYFGPAQAKHTHE